MGKKIINTFLYLYDTVFRWRHTNSVWDFALLVVTLILFGIDFVYGAYFLIGFLLGLITLRVFSDD